jgi:hypothetical protein
MQTSRSHLALTTALAAALGASFTYAVSSSQAEGYPAGAAVGYGSHPVVSYGGETTPGDSFTVTTAPADAHLVVSDVVLAMTASSYGCRASTWARLQDDTGRVLAEFGVSRGNLDQTSVTGLNSHFVSGVVLEAGRTMTFTSGAHDANCDPSNYRIRYTLAGYYAQP